MSASLLNGYACMLTKEISLDSKTGGHLNEQIHDNSEEALPFASQAASIETVSQYIDAVCDFAVEDSTIWYRGQRDSAWKLQPSIERHEGWLKHETDMLTRFRQLAASRIPSIPNDDWEWLCLAQHYRLPTRLLDWSENPLVGLFFAVEAAPPGEPETDSNVYALDASALNRSSYGADPGLLSLTSANAKLSDYYPGSPDSGLRAPLAVLAPQTFDRIVAQSGVFTIKHQLDVQNLDDSACQHIQKWVIPAEKKTAIRIQLAKLGITEASVYPDPDRIATLIRQSFTRGA